jgi:hypothetical protein
VPPAALGTASAVDRRCSLAPAACFGRGSVAAASAWGIAWALASASAASKLACFEEAYSAVVCCWAASLLRIIMLAMPQPLNVRFIGFYQKFMIHVAEQFIEQEAF